MSTELLALEGGANALELSGGDGCTTLRMYYTPLGCTP